MNNFVYHNPTKILFGKGTISKIGTEINGRGLKKALILAGSGSIKNNGVYYSAKESLLDSGVEFVELWGVRPNPTLDHARAAVKMARDFGADCILAIGGGSVIDEAKSIAAGFYIDDVWDAYERRVPVTKALPLFTILTISATGSEMNSGSVLSNEEEKKKWAFSSPLLFPVLSIIDPESQKTLPWNQTANGGVDALAHVMENYFVGTNQEITLALDEAMMRSIVFSIDQLQRNQKDYPARASFAWNATVALNGLAGAGLGGGDWSSHMIEHGISAIRPEVAHGAGLAVIFPAWIKYVADAKPEIFARWAKNVWQAESIDEAVSKMTAKFKSWELPTSLRDLNIDASEIPQIAENTMQVGRIGSIVSLNITDVEKILRIAF